MSTMSNITNIPVSSSSSSSGSDESTKINVVTTIMDNYQLPLEEEFEKVLASSSTSSDAVNLITTKSNSEAKSTVMSNLSNETVKDVCNEKSNNLPIPPPIPPSATSTPKLPPATTSSFSSSLSTIVTPPIITPIIPLNKVIKSNQLKNVDDNNNEQWKQFASVAFRMRHILQYLINFTNISNNETISSKLFDDYYESMEQFNTIVADINDESSHHSQLPVKNNLNAFVWEKSRLYDQMGSSLLSSLSSSSSTLPLYRSYKTFDYDPIIESQQQQKNQPQESKQLDTNLPNISIASSSSSTLYSNMNDISSKNNTTKHVRKQLKRSNIVVPSNELYKSNITYSKLNKQQVEVITIDDSPKQKLKQQHKNKVIKTNKKNSVSTILIDDNHHNVQSSDTAQSSLINIDQLQKQLKQKVIKTKKSGLMFTKQKSSLPTITTTTTTTSTSIDINGRTLRPRRTDLVTYNERQLPHIELGVGGIKVSRDSEMLNDWRMNVNIKESRGRKSKKIMKTDIDVDIDIVDDNGNDGSGAAFGGNSIATTFGSKPIQTISSVLIDHSYQLSSSSSSSSASSVSSSSSASSAELYVPPPPKTKTTTTTQKMKYNVNKKITKKPTPTSTKPTPTPKPPPQGAKKCTANSLQDDRYIRCDCVTIEKEPNLQLYYRQMSRKQCVCLIPDCHYYSESKLNIKRHVYQHFGANLFQCSLCSYRTNFKSKFTKHITGDNGPHKLSKLAYKYIKFIEVIQQQPSPPQQQPPSPQQQQQQTEFRCRFHPSKCKFTTTNVDALDQHVRTQHLDKYPFKCAYCMYRFKEFPTLRQHMQSKHHRIWFRNKRTLNRCPIQGCSFVLSNGGDAIVNVNDEEQQHRLQSDMFVHLRQSHKYCPIIPYQMPKYPTKQKLIELKQAKEKKNLAKQNEMEHNRAELEAIEQSLKWEEETIMEPATIGDSGIRMAYNCAQCRFRTNSMTKLRAHVERRHATHCCTKGGCEVLNRKFTSLLQLNIHLIEQHDVLPFQCRASGCEKSFERLLLLQQHHKQEHSIEFSTCNTCPTTRRFKTIEHYNRHRRLFHKLGDYRCTTVGCDFRAPYRFEVVKHKNKVHLPKVKCPICGATVHRQTYNVHVRRHDDTRPFMCPWPGCGKRFTDRQQLKDHTRIHLNFKRFKCKWENCDYASEQRSNVVKHVRIRHLHLPYTLHEQLEKNIPYGEGGKPQDYVEMLPDFENIL